MADADSPASCPEGHLDTTRLLSVFARTTAGGAPGPSAPTGGGCCGGACGCG
jgi:hypothetical protein